MAKKRDITVETPEKIKFSYRIAEIGTRIAAYIVDEIIQIVMVLIIVLALVFGGFTFQTHIDKNLANITAAFLMIMAFLLRWFYFVLFEVVMEGQSPGKRLMRIRVIRDNGDPLDFNTIIVRNFLRFVDGFPIIPLTGGFVALIDSQNRRLGDLIAGTIVVDEIQYNLHIPDFQVHFMRRPGLEETAFQEKAFQEKASLETASLETASLETASLETASLETAPPAVRKRLSENELYIIRRFLNEYYRLPEARQREIAAGLAEQVRKRLGIEEKDTDAFVFLERIYKQHGV